MIHIVKPSFKFYNAKILLSSFPDACRMCYAFHLQMCYSFILHSFCGKKKMLSSATLLLFHLCLSLVSLYDVKLEEKLILNLHTNCIDWFFFFWIQPWESYKADLSIDLQKHHVPKVFLDKVAYRTVKFLRILSDMYFKVKSSFLFFYSGRQKARLTLSLMYCF